MSNRWAIIIGINGYHESLGPLNFCANDAKLMHETLVSECCDFPSDNIVLLTDDQPKDRQPTFGNIHSWLGTWLSRPGPNDLVLVYFAGHGREADDQALLAPLDATLDSLPVTGIPIQYVRDMLDRCKASQKVLILDACHSGAGRDVATMGTSFREALDAGKGLYTIASCDADQISYEWPEKQHGVFTHYIAEALQHGAPVEPDGRVLLDRVYDWTRNGILAWTAGKRLKQEPVRICRVKGNIPIASRSLTLEQQLKVAKAQLETQHETIAKLQMEVDRLKKTNTALEQSASKPPKENNDKSYETHRVRRYVASAVAWPSVFAAGILAIIGISASRPILGTLAMGLVLLSALAWFPGYIYRDRKNPSGLILLTVLLAIALVLTLIVQIINPPSFAVDLPLIGPAMTRQYFTRYKSAVELKRQGDLETALQETDSLEESLRDKGRADLTDLHRKVVDLRREIVNEYGPAKRVWPERGRVMVWSDSLQQPIAIASFESIDSWLPSPDGQMIAFGVNGNTKVFVVDTNGTGLTTVCGDAGRNKNGSRLYWKFNGWKDAHTILIGTKEIRVNITGTSRPVGKNP